MPAFAGVLLAVSTVLVAGRFYLRARKEAGPFGLDDLLIAIGWLFAVGETALAIVDAGNYGLSRHTWDVPVEWFSGAAMYGWIAQVFMLTSTCATKCSVLLFYRRMVKDTGQWVYAIWAALAFTAAYFLAILVAYSLICQPLNSYWLSYDFSYHKPYKCIDGNVFSLCVGILSVISDLYAVGLPYIILRHYNLDVPRRQRIGLNIIFALGLLVAGAGVARTYQLWKINHTYDTSWAGFDLFVWSLVECHLAIICACAPSLRAFLRRYFGEAFNRTFNSRSYERSGQGSKKSHITTTTQRNSQMPQEQQVKGTSTVNERGVGQPYGEEVKRGAAIGSDVFARTGSSDTVPAIHSLEVSNTD